MQRPFDDYSVSCALRHIEDMEGFRAIPYRCPAGVLTVGFGHTGDIENLDTPLTYHEAEELLLADLKKFHKELAPHITVPVSESQYVALLSLAFNIGVYSLTHKCPKLMAALNSSDYEKAATEFLDITSGGIPGLVRRRKVEAQMMRNYA